MKELEKTKRISISTVAFILIIIIGVLTFKKPTNVYEKTIAQTQEILESKEYLTSIDSATDKENILVDIRNRFEYGKGHLDNAINIPSAEILNDINIELFKKYQEEDKQVVIYGADPVNANSSWMLLYQLGFENVKLLNASTNLVDNKLNVVAATDDKPIADYMEIFKVVVPKKAPVVKKVVKKQPIKVVPKKKKKKKRPEGGC